MAFSQNVLSFFSAKKNCCPNAEDDGVRVISAARDSITYIFRNFQVCIDWKDNWKGRVHQEADLWLALIAGTVFTIVIPTWV